MKMFSGMSLQRFFQAFTSLLLTGLVLIPGFSPLAWGEALKARVEYSDNAYRVGPGDTMSYQVYHQPDFSQDGILVRSDGNASFNGVGELQVAGKTVDEITQMLQNRIGELVINPKVSVTLTHTRPGTIYLAGAVMHPGMFQLLTSQSALPTPGGKAGENGASRTDFRLSNILANAGGVMLDADLTRVEVTRANSGYVKRVNLMNMLKNGDSEEDLWIDSGDSIFVPTAAQAVTDDDMNLILRSSIGPGSFPVRMLGQVGQPGLYELNATSPYLNSAIAKAAGFTPGANRQMIAIRRFTAEKPETLYLDPNKEDIVLRPNDIIFVSERKSYERGRFYEQAAKVLSPFASLAGLGFTMSYITGIKK